MMRKYYFKRKKKSFSLNFIILLVIIISIILFPIRTNLYDKYEILDDTNEDPSFIIQTSSSNPPNKTYFKYFKPITIKNEMVSGFGSYQNFPVLISILDSDLHEHVSQSNGNDIAFANDTGWLDHEIELFNQNYNGTHAKLVAWVLIPSLSTSVDTTIYLYYGNSTMSSQQNPTGVWSNNYRGVWHLSESAGNALDSTSYSTSGTVTGTVTRESPGKADGAYNFGNNGQINFGDPVDGHLDFGTGSFTISFWLNITYDNNDYQLPLHKGATTIYDVGYDFETNQQVETLTFRICDDSENIGESPNIDISGDIGDWIYITGIVDRASDRIRIFKNGLQEGTGGNIASIGNINNNNPLLTPTSAYDLYGSLDEIRICNIQRSAGWIATEYTNQNDPSSFYSIGIEIGVSGHPPNAHYFAYYKELVIDHTKVSGPDDLLNFPVLISIIDSDLHDHVQSNGNDIAFANQKSWLDHEIELFNQSYSSTHAQLIAWVRVPKLSTSTDTMIRMYYGNSTIESQENPEGVWDGNYKGVWHLSEDPTGTLYDSTSNDYDGTPQGSITSADKIDGQIDGSLELDGNDEYVDCGNPSGLQITGSMTVEAWFKANYFGNTYLISKNGPSGQRCWDLSFDPINSTHGYTIFRYAMNGESHADDVGNTTVPINEWIHAVGVFNAATYSRLFINGQMVDENTTSIISSHYDAPNNVRFGARGDYPPPNYFNGTIDEVRISNIARSAGWINTEYNNQYDPNSFYSIGKTHAMSGLLPNENYFNFYKEIIITDSLISGSHDLYNFPLLISIFDDDLSNKTQMNGDDIAFAFNGAWLDYEIELFNQNFNTTHAQLIAWVSVPILSPFKDNIIRMYYGNSTMGSQENPMGAWDSNYAAVWHLKEDPSGSLPVFKDSTSNNNNGSAQGGMNLADQVPGQIDGSIDFDGINDEITVPDHSSLDITESITISAWAYYHGRTSSDQTWAKLVFKPAVATVTDPWNMYSLGLDDESANQQEVRFEISTGVAGSQQTVESTSIMPTNTPTYIVATYDGSLMRIYINGVDENQTSTSITIGTSDFPLEIGDWATTEDNLWDGWIDEVRISSVARSADWIATEYNNQYNPQSFLTIGPENKLDGTPPTYSNLTESSDPLELGETEIITINVSDPSGIHQVQIEFEGSDPENMTNIIGDTWQYDSWIPSSVGNYSYTVWMEDNCNNWNSTTGSIEVIDTTPPTYSDLIESADPLQLGQNETISIKVYDSPGSGVNQVLLEYDSLNHTMSLVSGKWSWSKWKPNSTGIYPYKIFMEDMENNWNETSGTITVISSNAPTIENLTESENPLELGNIITINVDAVDNETFVWDVLIELESYNYTMTNIGGNTYEYNWTRSYVGIVYYTIYANDSDNNWNQFSSSFDIVDTTPPVVENLTVSEDPLEFGDIVIVTVNSTDLSDINQVWIEFEGTNHSMTNISGNAWQYASWSPSSTGNCSYTIWAEDNNNNWGFISSMILVQDTTLPIYSDLTEPPSAVELGDSIIISINATDLAGIKEVLIEYENSNHTMTKFGSDIWRYTNWEPTSIGNYTYKIYIADNNDNLNNISSSILIQDTILPDYSNLDVTDPLELGNNPIFDIDVYDIAGINQALIEFEGMNHSMTNIYGDTWRFDSWTPDNWIVYQYKIYMQDNSGNWNSLSGNITVRDTIAPSSPVITMAPSGDVSGILTFDWTEVYDPSGILYFILIIDNETDQVYFFNITNLGPESSYCELPDILPLGRYYYYLAQIDGTGKQSSYTMGSFTVVSFGNGGPGDNSLVIIIIIILASIIGSTTAMVIVRKRLKKDIIPPREKISFKIISSHIKKLSREGLTLQDEEIPSKTLGGIQDHILSIEEKTTEEELERYVNEIKNKGEQLFIEGAYLEAQEQFKLGRDFFLKLEREEEAKLFSELITGIEGLIEEREKRIEKLEEVKVEGDSVQIYENFYDIIEISKKLRDNDTENFYQTELVDYFQNNKLKIVNLEIYRYDLNEKAESFVNENKFEIAAQLYGKCEKISLLFVQLQKDGEVANIEKFRKKKAECSNKTNL